MRDGVGKDSGDRRAWESREGREGAGGREEGIHGTHEYTNVPS